MLIRSFLTNVSVSGGMLIVAGCGGGTPTGAPTSAASVETSSSSPATTTSASASATPTPTTGPTPTAGPTAAEREPALPRLGQRQRTNLGQVIVYSVKFPVEGTDDARGIRTKGTRFAVVDIKACANGSVDADGYGFDASNFQLTDDDDRTYEFWNVQVGARSPNLTDSLSALDTPRKGACKRGWLTFELPPKTKVRSVDYNPTGGGTPLTWRVLD